MQAQIERVLHAINRPMSVDEIAGTFFCAKEYVRRVLAQPIKEGRLIRYREPFKNQHRTVYMSTHWRSEQ